MDCGPGTDIARLDFADVIRDATVEAPGGSCERVQRRKPDPRDARAEDERESPGEDRDNG